MMMMMMIKYALLSKDEWYNVTSNVIQMMRITLNQPSMALLRSVSTTLASIFINE